MKFNAKKLGKLSTLFLGAAIALGGLAGCEDDFDDLAPANENNITTLKSATVSGYPDLSPWQNPAGANQGATTDITLGATPADGVPVEVSVDVFNYGDTLINTADNPVAVQLLGNSGNIETDADASNDTKTINDGTIINPGESVTVSFMWTPNVNNNTSAIAAKVDPSNTVVEGNENNNLSVKSVVIEQSTPTASITGFEVPLIMDDPNTPEIEILAINKKAKSTIPVKFTLVDENGIELTDENLPAGAAPKISVEFNAQASSSGTTAIESNLLNNGTADSGNTFRYEDGHWVYNLSTKGLKDSGVYTIKVSSGDENTYKIDQNTNAISFQRK